MRCTYNHILTGLDYNVGFPKKTTLSNYNYFVICNNYSSFKQHDSYLHIVSRLHFFFTLIILHLQHNVT